MIETIFRNKNKNEALSKLHIVILIAKVLMDILSKVLIFFCFMMVTNNGKFSFFQSVAAFYTLVGIMIVFNTIFSENRIHLSLRYFIGKF